MVLANFDPGIPVLVKAPGIVQVNAAMRTALLALFLCVTIVRVAQASEPVRQVQEELRKRNLFFGDIDGKISPELTGALRLYQTHKGFEANGQIDEVTARSLNIDTGESTTTTRRAQWPDLPVLKSDAARELPPAQQAALQTSAAAKLEIAPSPQTPAEGPSVSPALEPKQATQLIEDYLRTAETDDVAGQIKYYAYPVEYFDYGAVGKEYVKRDTERYLRRWPHRRYQLGAPIKIAPATYSGEVVVEFPITFEVRRKSYHATGKTRNFWTLRPEGDELKIVAIREQKVRE